MTVRLGFLTMTTSKLSVHSRPALRVFLKSDETSPLRTTISFQRSKLTYRELTTLRNLQWLGTCLSPKAESGTQGRKALPFDDLHQLWDRVESVDPWGSRHQ